jgi:phosphoribosyl-ATP pyrophosphohydrolase
MTVAKHAKHEQSILAKAFAEANENLSQVQSKPESLTWKREKFDLLYMKYIHKYLNNLKVKDVKTLDPNVRFLIHYQE